MKNLACGCALSGGSDLAGRTVSGTADSAVNANGVAAKAVIPIPVFEADTSQVPELQPWGRAAEALCQMWYPKIVAALQSDDSSRPLPPVVKIVFEKDMKGVAHVAGVTMHIAAGWIKSHPNDFGMVIHELTHLVQRYPSYEAVWLVEGIADYVRAKHFEPQLAPSRINFARAKHTDSYKTTAAFLMWVETNYDKALVPKLRRSSQQKIRGFIVQDYTGKDVTQLLWSSRKRNPRTASAARSATINTQSTDPHIRRYDRQDEFVKCPSCQSWMLPLAQYELQKSSESPTVGAECMNSCCGAGGFSSPTTSTTC